MIPITGIYLSLAAGLFLWLSVRVIAYRRLKKISLGDEGDKGLIKRMRAQANFVEYTPLAMLMLAAIEMNGAPALIIHLLGISFLAGRAIHAYGFSSRPPNMQMRKIGMVLTLAMMGLAITVLMVASIL